MNFKEILINNPITGRSIDNLIDEIKLCNSSFLLINVGAHYFESIEVLKELKDRLNLESNTLSRFRKIAFLNSSGFKNKSENEDRYNFFCDKEEAVEWLTAI
jgi:hypothetical protein